MIESIYDIAGQQLLERAAGYAETGKICLILALIFSTVSMIFWNVDLDGWSIFAGILFLMLLIASFMSYCEFYAAKDHPELYVVERLGHRTRHHHHPVSVPMRR